MSLLKLGDQYMFKPSTIMKLSAGQNICLKSDLRESGIALNFRRGTSVIYFLCLRFTDLPRRLVQRLATRLLRMDGDL
jgi:hypothetical protein